LRGSTIPARTSVTPEPAAISRPCRVTTPPRVALAPPPTAGTGPNASLIFRAGPNAFLYGNDGLVVDLPNDGTIRPSDSARGLPAGV
jgi:hypothetical protein